MNPHQNIRTQPLEAMNWPDFLRIDFSQTISISHLLYFFTYNHADFLCTRRISNLYYYSLISQTSELVSLTHVKQQSWSGPVVRGAA